MDCSSLESRPDLTVKTERLSAPFAAELLASAKPPLVVDVRAPREREQKYIAGSVSIPLNHLEEKTGNAAEGSSAAGLLCGRIPVVDCGELVANAMDSSR